MTTKTIRTTIAATFTIAAGVLTANAEKYKLSVTDNGLRIYRQRGMTIIVK